MGGVLGTLLKISRRLPSFVKCRYEDNDEGGSGGDDDGGDKVEDIQVICDGSDCLLLAVNKGKVESRTDP